VAVLAGALVGGALVAALLFRTLLPEEPADSCPSEPPGLSGVPACPPADPCEPWLPEEPEELCEPWLLEELPPPEGSVVVWGMAQAARRKARKPQRSQRENLMTHFP
jgi:hypothetical protein